MGSLFDRFILDFGSFTTKYGLAAEELQFPTENHTIVGTYEKEGFSGVTKVSAGTSVLKDKEITGGFRLKTLHPMVSRGQLKLSSETVLYMESFLNQTFRSCYAMSGESFSMTSLRDKHLSVSLAQVQSEATIKDLTQLIFEKYGMSSLQCLNPLQNIAYVLNDTTSTQDAFIMEIGHGITQLGRFNSSAYTIIPLGGMDVTKYIKDNLGTDEPILKLTELKETNCNCIVPSISTSVESNVYNQAPETLFKNPFFISNISQFLVNSLQSSSSTDSPTLFISGGTSLLKNFKERLQYELSNSNTLLNNIQIQHSKLGKDTSYFGACKQVATDYPSALNTALREDYKEKGVSRLLAEVYPQVISK